MGSFKAGLQKYGKSGKRKKGGRRKAGDFKFVVYSMLFYLLPFAFCLLLIAYCLLTFAVQAFGRKYHVIT